MKYFTRIVTFMAYPEIFGDNPQVILSGGSRTITLPEKERYFVARKVCFEDNKPIYSRSTTFKEKRYNSIKEVLCSHPGLCKFPILDNDNKLNEFHHE